MALQKEPLEASVSKVIDRLWNITITFKCTDNSIEVFNQSFATSYRPGQDSEARVKAMLDEMQKAINDYKGEQSILESSQLATAMTWLENNLVV